MIVTTDIGNIRKDCHSHEEATAGDLLEEVFRRSESLCARFEQE